ncbi:hypothetical protein D3C76_108170 [compost metagenome]
MHTSVTTHHRIFFANVTKPDYLEGLCLDLGMEKVSDTIYDFVLQEGTSMSVEGACRIAVKVAALGNAEGDPEDLLFMLGCIARLLADRGYTPHSTTFEADVDLETLVDQDISCLELFDLLSALSYGYEVRGIYSQWAMTSNKAQFGANAGGTRITMRDFSIPCSVYPDDAEGLIYLLAQHRPENIGDIYLMKLILPLIEMPGILNKTMELSVHAALARFLGGVPLKPLEDIIPEHLRSIGGDLSKLKMKDEYTFVAPAVLRKPRAAPTLDDFRNFEPNKWQTRISVDQQFYLAWFAIPLHPSGHCPELPEGYEKVVEEIRDRLATGEELDCPAIERFHNPIPPRIECEIPTIMPRASDDILDRGRSAMLSQTGFERDAKPLDPADLQDIHMRGVSLARSSQSEHTYGGVPMEQTGRDFTQETSSNRHFSPEPSPSPSPDNSTTSSDTSTSSFD